MGHNVNYTGKLFLKKPLTETQIEKFKLLQDDDKNFDRLYAVIYFDKSTEWYFEVDNDCEKLYPISYGGGLFESLKKYLDEENLEIYEDSFIMCCSDYGSLDDEEALVLHIQNGSICFTPIREIVTKFVKGSPQKRVYYLQQNNGVVACDTFLGFTIKNEIVEITVSLDGKIINFEYKPADEESSTEEYWFDIMQKINKGKDL